MLATASSRDHRPDQDTLLMMNIRWHGPDEIRGPVGAFFQGRRDHPEGAKHITEDLKVSPLYVEAF